MEKNRVVKNQCHLEVHSESGKENNSTPEYHEEYTAEEIKQTMEDKC